jgi:hypothetical protein
MEILHTAIEAFHWRDAYDARVELDVETNELVVLAIVREQPPPSWGPLFGDLVHNLRSALDHLAIALVIANKPKASTRTNGFPIFDLDPSKPNASKRDKDAWKALVKNMSAAQIAAIRAVQPFNTPLYGDLVNTLSVLRELSDTDKHRGLVPIGGVVGESVELVPRKLDGWQLDVPLATPPVRKIKDGAVLARFRLTPLVPDPDMDVDVGAIVRVAVTLEEGVPGTGKSIDQVLRFSYTRVLDIVNDFEKRFFS